MELSKAKISRYALLRHKKYRDRERLFIVQGKKAVADTICHFEAEAVIEDLDAIRKISTLENIPDVIAVYRIPERHFSSELPDIGMEEMSSVFSLVLDGIQDPGNLGTIIRTAHWFGIKRIFCSRDTVDLYNPKVVMSTMGSIARIEVIYCNLETLLSRYRGIPVYGLLLDGENIFKQGKLPYGFILMGSEGHGPTEKLREYISRPLTIPPAESANHPDSLNVAVATAVTLSQLVK